MRPNDHRTRNGRTEMVISRKSGAATASRCTTDPVRRTSNPNASGGVELCFDGRLALYGPVLPSNGTFTSHEERKTPAHHCRGFYPLATPDYCAGADDSSLAGKIDLQARGQPRAVPAPCFAGNPPPLPGAVRSACRSRARGYATAPTRRSSPAFSVSQKALLKWGRHGPPLFSRASYQRPLPYRPIV